MEWNSDRGLKGLVLVLFMQYNQKITRKAKVPERTAKAAKENLEIAHSMMTGRRMTKRRRQCPYKRKHFPSTPFTTWLCNYAEENETTLAVMSLDAGLSRGLLNMYVAYPERKQDLRTILKLSKYTGKSADEIARLAGIAGYRPRDIVDPDIEELVKVYKRLPPSMKSYLLKSAHALSEATRAQRAKSTKENQKR